MKTSKITFKAFLLYILCVALLFSCNSSDDNDDGNQPTNTLFARLTNGVWYLQDETQTSTDSCERNTSYNFKGDNTLVVQGYFEDGLGVCQDLVPGNFTFELDSDLSELITTQMPNGTVSIYTIIELTSDVLIIEREFNGFINTITFDRTAG